MGWQVFDSGGQAKSAVFQAGATNNAVRATQTAPQTAIAHATWTTLDFDLEDFDYGGLHDTVTNNSRITILESGVYHVTAGFTWDQNGAGSRATRIIKNGVTGDPKHYVSDGGGHSAAHHPGVEIATDLDLQAGDYIEIQVYQDSGAALDLEDPAYGAPAFFAAHLASPMKGGSEWQNSIIDMDYLSLDTWGPVARSQGIMLQPNYTDTTRDDGAGNLTIPTGGIIVANPIAGSFVIVAAGTYALSNAWDHLFIDLPPTAANGATIVPTVGAWTNNDREYDNRDRILIARRRDSGEITMGNGVPAWRFSNVPSARMYLTGNESTILSDATFLKPGATSSTWSAVLSDASNPDGMVDGSFERLNINTPGMYRVSWNVAWGQSVNGTVIVLSAIYKNGVLLSYGAPTCSNGGGGIVLMSGGTRIVKLAAGDYLEPYGYWKFSGSGGNYSYTGGPQYTYFSAEMIGL